MSQTPIIDRETKPSAKRSPERSSNWKDRLENQISSDSLSLVDLFIGDEGAYEVAKFLKKTNNHFYSLQLRGNNISAAGFEVICEALKGADRLNSITAEWNNIGSDISGLVALHGLVKGNHTLETVDLKNNRLGQNCARIVADIIRDSNSLKKMDLRWNELGEEGGRQILAALQESKKRVTLDLNGNKIPEEILSQIQDAAAGRVSVVSRNFEERSQPPSTRNLTSEKQITLSSYSPPRENKVYSTGSDVNLQGSTLPSKYSQETQSYSNAAAGSGRLSSNITKSYSGNLRYNAAATGGTTSSPPKSHNMPITITSPVVSDHQKTTTTTYNITHHTYSPQRQSETRARPEIVINDGNSRNYEHVKSSAAATTTDRYSPPRQSYAGRNEAVTRSTYEISGDINRRTDLRTLAGSGAGQSSVENLALTSKYQPKYSSSAIAGLTQSSIPSSNVQNSTLKRSTAVTTHHSTYDVGVKDADGSEAKNLMVGKLISDLERALEREKIRANEAEGKLSVISRDYEVESTVRQDLERKYGQILEDLKRSDSEVHTLRIELDKYNHDNTSLNAEVNVLRQEVTRLEEYSKTRLAETEERYRIQLRNSDTQNQQLREEINTIQRDLNGQIVDIRRESDGRSRQYEEQIGEFAKLNDELSNELASQLEYIEKLKIEHEVSIKRTAEKVRDEEVHKAQMVIRELEDELRSLKINHEQLQRKNAEMLTDLQAYEKQIREQHIQFGNELNRVGGDIDRLRGELNQANAVIQKQNHEISSRDSSIAKLEGDLERFRAEIQRISDVHVQQIDTFKRDYENERRRFEDVERQLHQRIEEYDRKLVESQNETVRVTREYDRLVDIMQGNVSRVIQDTFLTHKNTSEIRVIENRTTSTLNTPSRGLGGGAGQSSQIFEKKYF